MRQLRLVKQMFLGFGVMVVIAGLMGLVGYYSTSQMSAQMAVLQKWSTIDEEMNEAVIQRTIALNGKLQTFARKQDEESRAKLYSALENSIAGVNEWKELVKEDNTLATAAEKVQKVVNSYSTKIGSYEQKLKEIKKSRRQLDKIVDKSCNFLIQVMEETIDPAKEKAEQAKDINEMVAWGNIDMLMNEAVIANTLKLQTAYHDYCASGADSDWETIHKQEAVLDEGMKEWEATFNGNAEMEKALAQVRKLVEECDVLSHKVHKAYSETKAIENQLVKAGNDVLLALDDVMENTLDPAKDAAYAKAEEEKQHAEMLIMFFAFGVIALGAALAIFITRSIALPIKKIIEQLSTGSEQVAAASEQVATSSQLMAEGASEQASSLEEISSSLEEMSSMTKQNAENAANAELTAKESHQLAQEGSEAMNRMNEAIDEIKSSSDETAKIVKTIDEIAFQTNLLALNAAVEAARAGDAGKGFAVVAEEVRNLAQRSAEAARNTSELIEGSQKNADNGVAVTREVLSIFENIGSSIGGLSRLVGEVSAASSEQSQGIEQVNLAVAQMDTITQSNASNAEESSSAAQELSAQSNQLDLMINQLNKIVTAESRRVESSNSKPSPKALECTMSHERSHIAPVTAQPRKNEGSMQSMPMPIFELNEDELADF